MKGNFREALLYLESQIGELQYHPEHGQIVRDILIKWDKIRGDDWIHETLNEFKEKQNECV